MVSKQCREKILLGRKRQAFKQRLATGQFFEDVRSGRMVGSMQSLYQTQPQQLEDMWKGVDDNRHSKAKRTDIFLARKMRCTVICKFRFFKWIGKYITIAPVALDAV